MRFVSSSAMCVSVRSTSVRASVVTGAPRLKELGRREQAERRFVAAGEDGGEELGPACERPGAVRVHAEVPALQQAALGALADAVVRQARGAKLRCLRKPVLGRGQRGEGEIDGGWGR
jgi:hypothetical protein